MGEVASLSSSDNKVQAVQIWDGVLALRKSKRATLSALASFCFMLIARATKKKYKVRLSKRSHPGMRFTLR